mmetsp:Transcript_13623/g.37844  ORF Transcript_13623/g.37844 Transcript_13623/m.37844 type:complete len:234 (+) Transcript_13623:270-971(+)
MQQTGLFRGPEYSLMRGHRKDSASPHSSPSSSANDPGGGITASVATGKGRSETAASRLREAVRSCSGDGGGRMVVRCFDGGGQSGRSASLAACAGAVTGSAAGPGDGSGPTAETTGAGAVSTTTAAAVASSFSSAGTTTARTVAALSRPPGGYSGGSGDGCTGGAGSCFASLGNGHVTEYGLSLPSSFWVLHNASCHDVWARAGTTSGTSGTCLSIAEDLSYAQLGTLMSSKQ